MKKSIIALMMMISLNAFAAGPTQECKDKVAYQFNSLSAGAGMIRSIVEYLEKDLGSLDSALKEVQERGYYASTVLVMNRDREKNGIPTVDTGKDEAKRWFEDNARVLPNCNVIFFT